MPTATTRRKAANSPACALLTARFPLLASKKTALLQSAPGPDLRSYPGVFADIDVLPASRAGATVARERLYGVARDAGKSL